MVGLAGGIYKEKYWSNSVRPHRTAGRKWGAKMSVITKTIEIGQIPAIIWGSPAPKSYFYVHGQEGCKEEAAILANIICPHGFQVLSIDLPEHGERLTIKSQG